MNLAISSEDILLTSAADATQTPLLKRNTPLNLEFDLTNFKAKLANSRSQMCRHCPVKKISKFCNPTL